MILESITIAAFALVLDYVLGDPRNRYHPTAWIGALIAKLTPAVKNQNDRAQKAGGILIVATAAGVTVALLAALDLGIALLTVDWVALAASVITGTVLLKTTIAVKGMQRHALAVVDSLERDDLASARANLAMIVKRNTKNLDKDHVISGVLESVSENTVDGITGPLFYYALFGLPGAFVYRIVNTADSMIGYKTSIFRNVGWFAAGCDSVLNYIPSRITGLVMIVSAALLQNNWKESYKTMIRDGKKTESQNAGYPMAALAGALGTKFEKADHYELGSGAAALTKQHVHSAISIMKLTSILFFGIVVVPVISVLSVIGWWAHA